MVFKRRAYRILRRVKFAEYRVEIEVDHISVHTLSEVSETPLYFRPLFRRQVGRNAVPDACLPRDTGQAVRLFRKISGYRERRRIVAACYAELRLPRTHRDKIRIRKLHGIRRIIDLFPRLPNAVIQVHHRNPLASRLFRPEDSGGRSTFKPRVSAARCKSGQKNRGRERNQSLLHLSPFVFPRIRTIFVPRRAAPAPTHGSVSLSGKKEGTSAPSSPSGDKFCSHLLIKRLRRIGYAVTLLRNALDEFSHFVE